MRRCGLLPDSAAAVPASSMAESTTLPIAGQSSPAPPSPPPPPSSPVFVEFGAGRGMLSLAVRSAAPSAAVLLVDRASSRNKADHALRKVRARMVCATDPRDQLTVVPTPGVAPRRTTPHPRPLPACGLTSATSRCHKLRCWRAQVRRGGLCLWWPSLCLPVLCTWCGPAAPLAAGVTTDARSA
eukprot:COSAG01_NODE_5174_length_4433_cov_2.338486_2_plen_184_part_00